MLTNFCRVFVMPSRMCINPIHNKKGILHHSSNATSEERYDPSLYMLMTCKLIVYSSSDIDDSASLYKVYVSLKLINFSSYYKI